MKKNQKGFTIIELLVVIAIIGFLASALAVAAVGLAARSRIEKSAAVVRKVDAACEAYHTKFQDFPAPESPAYAKLTAADIAGGKTWPPIHSQTLLYDKLCRELTAVEGFGAAAKKRTLEPFIEVVDSEMMGDTSMMNNVQIVDAWRIGIWYDLPGAMHGSNFPDRSNKFDLTSCGPDMMTSFDTLNPGDDVCNWTVDKK